MALINQSLILNMDWFKFNNVHATILASIILKWWCVKVNLFSEEQTDLY